MRVLLDENLPRKLKWSVQADDVLTVPERGWAGIKNGDLLQRAAAEFDVLLTMDRGIEHQQRVDGLDLCLIVLSALSNDIDDLLPLAPAINAALQRVQPGVVLHVPWSAQPRPRHPQRLQPPRAALLRTPLRRDHRRRPVPQRSRVG